MYRTAVKERTENARKDLIAHYESMKEDIEQRMESYLEKGYFGWEFMRDPFLWKDECKETIIDITEKIKKLGYTLFMNSKYHTLAIIPNQEQMKEYKDCFVGFGSDIQFIHYTLDDRTIDTMKSYKKDMEKWKKNIEKRLCDLENKVDHMWFVPGMPGFLEAEENFIKETQKNP